MSAVVLVCRGQPRSFSVTPWSSFRADVLVVVVVVAFVLVLVIPLVVVVVVVVLVLALVTRSEEGRRCGGRTKPSKKQPARLHSTRGTYCALRQGQRHQNEEKLALEATWEFHLALTLEFCLRKRSPKTHTHEQLDFGQQLSPWLQQLVHARCWNGRIPVFLLDEQIRNRRRRRPW